MIWTFAIWRTLAKLFCYYSLKKHKCSLNFCFWLRCFVTYYSWLLQTKMYWYYSWHIICAVLVKYIQAIYQYYTFAWGSAQRRKLPRNAEWQSWNANFQRKLPSEESYRRLCNDVRMHTTLYYSSVWKIIRIKK